MPTTINEAKAVIASVDLAAMEPLAEGYRYTVWPSDYGEVEQRWVVIFSEAAQGRAQKRTRQQLARQAKKEQKAFRKLTQRVFWCQQDAERALEAFEASLQATTVEQPRVLECVHVGGLGEELAPTGQVSYRIRGKVVLSQARQAALIARKSLFILSTNELDAQALSAEEVLAAYKGQARVERGFRFLKDPLFLASSLFLKNEKRIMALLMVMTLCLLVYSALEWRIREGLREQGETSPDQKGRPTQRPTARWVFQCFVGIHVLIVAEEQLVLNLQERHYVIMKVICDRRGWPYKQTDTASVLLRTILDRSSLEPFFKDPLSIVATLRNRLSTSHGGGTAIRSVPAHIAKYAVNATASMILLLVEETS